MNTNATIVFKFINYGGEARKPRQIMQNTINVFCQAHLALIWHYNEWSEISVKNFTHPQNYMNLTGGTLSGRLY